MPEPKLLMSALPTSDASIATFFSRKSNIFMLNYIMTMDVLFLDEIGQLSSEQFMQLDIILRQVRGNNIPFGGVLILGK